MEKEGFRRTIHLTDGPLFQLPTAEYNKSASLTTDQVLELAKKAAATTKKKFGVLVTKADGVRAWFGLQPAE